MIIPKRKIYFICVTFILLIIVAFIVILPTSKEMKDVSAQIYKQKQELEKLYLSGRLLRPTKEQYEKVKFQIPDLSKIFVNDGEELQFITALEKIADDNNLDQEIDMREVTTEEEAQTKDYQKIPITLKVIGGYQNFINYLAGLESLDYYINIEDFRILTSSNGNFRFTDKQPASDSISALINGNIYRKHQ